MEQQTATETKVVIKRTIPNKQKSAIKLVMWTLSQVMEKDAMISKIVEMFKVTDTIETIIEMVDAVEKSPEYMMMDTELTAIRSPKTKKRAKVTGDPDAIIKQLVDMATTETAGGKKKAKTEGEEKPKKAPRGKKAAKPPSTDAPAATDAPTTDVETEPKKKAPRAKKVAEPKAITTEEAPKAPTDETTAPPAPKTPPSATAKPTTEPKAKKAPAKNTKTTVESNGTTPETEPAKPKAKAPKAPKTKAPSEIAHPNEVVEVAEDLREDEYMLLNEVEVDGKTYMVDSSQNVYNEFNDVIGKYENGVVTMNA